MPATRNPGILAAILASLLAAPAARGQTLLWSARQHLTVPSGYPGNLGNGKPFRVDGSGAVTVAAYADTSFFLLRYKPDGTLDQMSVQTPPELFNGTSVIVDARGRAFWSGGPVALPFHSILARHSLGSGWESLYPGYFANGVLVEGAADDAVFLVSNYSGTVALYSVMKLHEGAPQSDWSFFLGLFFVPAGYIAITPSPSGGLVISDSFNGYVAGIDEHGTRVWVASPVPQASGTPAVTAIGGLGRVHISGPAPAGDFGTVTLDPDGHELWQRTWDGAGHGTDVPTGIAADVGGSVYVTGSSIGASGSSDFATIKYDPAGNPLWARTYDGGGEDTPVGIAVDGAGNAWVTGTSGDDVVTLKYDSSGAQVFTHRFVPPGPATVAGVAVDGWGNATVAFSAAGDIFVLRYGQTPVSVGPLALTTVDPCRAFDSRDATLGGPNPLVGPSDHRITLAGTCAVPASARAVSLNLTVVDSTQPGSIALFPADQTPATTSALNYSAGQTRANNATVGLGATAGLGLRVAQGGGSVHVLIDVVGYWQ